MLNLLERRQAARFKPNYAWTSKAGVTFPVISAPLGYSSKQATIIYCTASGGCHSLRTCNPWQWVYVPCQGEVQVSRVEPVVYPEAIITTSFGLKILFAAGLLIKFCRIIRESIEIHRLSFCSSHPLWPISSSTTKILFIIPFYLFSRRKVLFYCARSSE